MRDLFLELLNLQKLIQACTTCKPEKDLVNYKCICHTGYFEDDQFNCQQCDLFCIQCQSKDLCLACEQNLLIKLSNNKCVCIDGYFLNQTTLQCQQCDSNCKTCVNDSKICLTCDIEQNKILQDNQCICLDNYIYDDENYDCISCLSEQAKQIKQCNFQDCNDGVWTYGEQCDDNNQIQKDGCFNCQIEASFYCINKILQSSNCQRCQDGCLNCYYDYILQKINCLEVQNGYFLNQQLEIQKCNNKCKTCFQTASQCTECQYLNIGRTQINCQFCEYKQGYYSNIETYECYTECGDGIQSDNEQCDDGNLFNNDGCDDQFQIEKQFNCEKGICTKIQSPIPQAQKIKIINLYDPERQVEIKYDQLLNLPTDFNFSNCLKLSIEQDSEDQINYTYTIIQNITHFEFGSQVQFTINLNFFQSIHDQQLQINFEKCEIENYQEIKQEINILKVDISDFEYITQISKQTTLVFIQSANIMIYYLLALFFIGVLFGGLDIYYDLLDVMQYYSYIYYINNLFPANLDQFLLDLRKFQLTFYQNLFDLQYFFEIYFDFDLTKYQNNVPLKIKNQEIIGSFLVNASFIFPIFTSSFALYLIIKITTKYWKNISDCSHSKIQQSSRRYYFSLMIRDYIFSKCATMINEYFYSGILRLYMSSCLEVCFALSLGLKGLFFNNVFDIFNTLAIILSFFFYLFMLYIVLNILNLKKCEMRQKPYILKFGAVIDGIKVSNTRYSIFYNPYILFKKLLFMMFLIQVYDYPLFQAGLIFALNCATCIILIKTQPYTDKIEFQKQLICELSQTLTITLITTLCISDYMKYFNQTFKSIIGWICIVNILIALVTQVILDSIQQSKCIFQKNNYLRNKIKQCQDSCFKKGQIVQINKIMTQ